jgi:hypothetical protein
MKMLVYTYLIVKEPNSLKILYRRKDPITSRSTILGSAKQTNIVAAKLRKEIDKEIDKRLLKSVGASDAKRPDNKLRDEFARWMASGVSVSKSNKCVDRRRAKRLVIARTQEIELTARRPFSLWLLTINRIDGHNMRSELMET